MIKKNIKNQYSTLQNIIEIFDDWDVLTQEIEANTYDELPPFVVVDEILFVKKDFEKQVFKALNI